MKNFLLILSIMVLSSCSSGTRKAPIDLRGDKSPEEIIVPYSEKNGIKTISVRLNGVSMEMIYDPGCSGVQISLLELQTLYKNGEFSEGDILGTNTAQIADGSIVENGVINIREIEIGGKNGITLPNVEASVSLNLGAPILLGNGVLDRVASVEVDNVEKVIRFRRN